MGNEVCISAERDFSLSPNDGKKGGRITNKEGTDLMASMTGTMMIDDTVLGESQVGK